MRGKGAIVSSHYSSSTFEIVIIVFNFAFVHHFIFVCLLILLSTQWVDFLVLGTNCVLRFDASELRVDFTGALTSGPTVFFPVESFFGIVVAEPLIPRGVELTTIDPQIGVRTGIGAELAQFARAFAAAARRTLLVRTAQTFHVVASVG